MNKTSDHYDCEGGTDRRKHCEMVIAMNAKFIDFMARYEKDQELTNEWRSKIESKVEGIGKMLETLSIPYKIALAFGSVAALAMIGEIIKTFVLYIKNRIH